MYIDKPCTSFDQVILNWDQFYQRHYPWLYEAIRTHQDELKASKNAQIILTKLLLLYPDKLFTYSTETLRILIIDHFPQYIPLFENLLDKTQSTALMNIYYVPN